MNHRDEVAAPPRRTRRRRVQPLDAVIGQRVRLRRIARGMSQEALADALGLSFQQVQKYERGCNRIGAGRLAQIAACLGVPAGFFFEPASGPSDAVDGTRERPTWPGRGPEELALAQAFGRITSSALRRRVIALAEALANGAGAAMPNGAAGRQRMAGGAPCATPTKAAR